MAVLGGTVLACHGGLPKDAPDLQSLGRVRPEETTMGVADPDDAVLCQWMWNDPDLQGREVFAPNSAQGGGIHFFPARALHDYLDRHGLQAMVRGHQPFPHGWRRLHGRRLVSFHTTGRYPRTLPPHVGLLDAAGLRPLRLDDRLWDGPYGDEWTPPPED